MNLVIVESPTKAKTITKFLAKEYLVKSSFGHIRDLPQKELGIDIENDFEPKYVIPAKSRKAVKELREAAKKSDLIILATDEDREGEAIAWHIAQALKLKINDKRIKRIAFHEITKTAINQALENPRQVNMYLVDAQQARRILDRLVGYKLSPFLWKKVAKGLSAGRVQSVAVRLIVDREKEIEEFKPEEYWTIDAQLSKEKTKEEFIAHLVKKDGKTISRLGIRTKEQGDEIISQLKEKDYQVVDVRSKTVKKEPAPPFTTSALQQQAAQKFGFSSKQTMRLAQQLYEGVKLGKDGLIGLITYHRTDSLNLSNEALAESQSFIKKEFGGQYGLDKPRFYKTKSKLAQEAHEAIRPTQASRQPEQIRKYLDPRQFKLYQLIWQRFIACQMAAAILDTNSVDIQAGQYLFRANGSIIKFDGFLKVYPLKLKESLLPKLAKEEILKLLKLISEQHFTQAPGRYNEASLIKILEEYGIGRPSTYAPIISAIQDRGYVQKNPEKRFVPSEIGVLVTGLLKENFAEIVDIEFTAKMEKELDQVANNKQDKLTLLKNFYGPFSENLAKKYQEVEKKKMEEATDKKCPQCGKPIVIKMSRFGKFYACSGFPECRYKESIVNSSGVKCPKCQKGEIIERKTRKGKTFYSCSRWPECDFALWDKPTGEKCPKCGSLMVKGKGNKDRCSNKECKQKNRLE
jgi:DNA topoisomerase-1